MATCSPGYGEPRPIHACSTAFWRLGLDGRIRAVNRSAAEIGGRAGAAWRDGWSREARAAADRALATARSGGTAVFRVETGWGSRGRVQAEITVTPLFDDSGELEGFSASARDVTLELETAAFLANLNHEIRTPLHGLVAAAAILEARPLAPADRELASIMRASALALAGQLKRVLGDPSCASASAALPDDGDVAPESCGRLRILVADDHPTNRRVVELILGEFASVRTVNDGLQAIEAFAEQPFDLVLMDIQMPVLDGIGAVSEIRRWEAAHKRRRTPIAMLTANTDPANVAASRAAGADRHIAKPFTPNLLVSCVQELVHASAA